MIALCSALLGLALGAAVTAFTDDVHAGLLTAASCAAGVSRGWQ